MSAENSAAVESKLLDFDWQIRHVMGSSSLRSLEDTLIQLTFHIQDPNSPSSQSDIKNITVEFSRDELRDFVTALQSAKKAQ